KINIQAGDEKLAAICAGTTVCLMETKQTHLSKLKIFICKWPPVDTGNSGTISLSREKGSVNDLRVSTGPASRLVYPAKNIFLPKILRRLRHNVCKELNLHTTNFLQPARDVQKAQSKPVKASPNREPSGPHAAWSLPPPPP
uniref:Uncharacterized protein n=1 Tax=Bos indicus x Bos taurus TaxID=30522 RepID=A0A4W2DER1_BOBOX